MLLEIKTSVLVRAKTNKNSLAALHSFINLMPCGSNKSSDFKHEGINGKQPAGLLQMSENGFKKTHERIKQFVQLELQSCKSLDHCGVFLQAVKLVIWECRILPWGLKCCESLEWQVALIY